MRTLLQHRPKGLLRVGLPDVPRLTANADFCRLLKALQVRGLSVFHILICPPARLPPDVQLQLTMTDSPGLLVCRCDHRTATSPSPCDDAQACDNRGERKKAYEWDGRKKGFRGGERYCNRLPPGDLHGRREPWGATGRLENQTKRRGREEGGTRGRQTGKRKIVCV